VLAGRREVPIALRGLFLGSAGLLCCLAILGQSRGWLLSLPLMAVLAVVVVPGRVRTLAALAAVGIAVAPIAATLTDYYQAFESGQGPPGPIFGEAVDATILVSLALLLVGLAAAYVDRRVRVPAGTARRAGVAVVVAFALACVGGVAAAAVAVGDPVGEIEQRWDEFQSGEGEPSFTGSRLASTSFQSYRSDAWRVAWENFERRPLTGVGADNFLRDYLQRGESDQTPSYPHSLEFRTLSETGLIGFLLLGGAIALGIVAALPALRSGPGLAGVAAGAGVLGFSYWAVHGSVDWFFEVPGLGAPAFAMLGLAGAVSAFLHPERGRPLRPGRRATIGAACLAVLVAFGLTLPWLAERDLREARETAAADPGGALDKLDRATDLNPLSPLAPKTAALIEARQGRFNEAKADLETALERDDRDSFPYLQLAAIASTQMREARARRLIERARELAPRDQVVARVRRALRAGRTVTPQRLNELILENIDVRIGPE
jgi:O-antigen ligase